MNTGLHHWISIWHLGATLAITTYCNSNPNSSSFLDLQSPGTWEQHQGLARESTKFTYNNIRLNFIVIPIPILIAIPAVFLPGMNSFKVLRNTNSNNSLDLQSRYSFESTWVQGIGFHSVNWFLLTLPWFWWKQSSSKIRRYTYPHSAISKKQKFSQDSHQLHSFTSRCLTADSLIIKFSMLLAHLGVP